MPGHSTKRGNFWIPLLFFFLLATGVLLGFYLNNWLGHKRPIMTVIERNDRLEEIIHLIGERYVDPINTDSLYEDAISGILKHLDPHTAYIPARDMARVTANLEGNFKGIGIEYLIISDTIMVSAVIKNGPSEEAGLAIGDQLIKVDTHLVAGTGITADQISKLLSGLQDSEIRLLLRRPGQDTLTSLTVHRGIIPLYSIDAAYMIDDTIGYIRINRFSATTYREFKKSLVRLNKSGMTALIVDLRQNPGGYLDAATAIADEFLDDEKLLVYTEGRKMPVEKYQAQQQGAFEQGPLAILVDEGSASASEILAGAIQDWDRGIIIGRRTFGKGLVQEQFELGDGSVLRLTVARYYTPTGRAIQRPYDDGKEAYQRSYMNRFLLPDSLRATQDSIRSPKYYTKIQHREVTGAGGILPDVIVPYETEQLIQLFHLTNSTAFKNTLFRYYAGHKKAVSPYQDINEFIANFKVPAELIDSMKAQISHSFPNQIYFNWNDPELIRTINLEIKAEYARILFGDTGYYRVRNRSDKMMMRALSLFKSPGYSELISGQ